MINVIAMINQLANKFSKGHPEQGSQGFQFKVCVIIAESPD